MAEGSVKAKMLNRTEVLVPLAKAVASATKAYKEELAFEALAFISSLPLLWEARRYHGIFLPLALLTLTFNCP